MRKRLLAAALLCGASLMGGESPISETIRIDSLIPVALRDGILYVRVLQPALHYELEQISKSDILRKLKQRFGTKIIRDVRFRVG